MSAEALTQACLERISTREPEVHAWEFLDPNQALAQARDIDRRRADGGAIGPLHGLPVGVKDIIDTADMPTGNGSAIFDGNRPSRDAQCVAALRAAGAVILGKTVTTELANRHPNKTRNPHNPAYSPGGSSSGSGAGVADYHMPLALGTQTGGSVIRPASYNGIYGLKPTLGMIPRAGVLLQSHMLDTIGVYGRSLADLALLFDVLSQPDPADAQSYSGSRLPTRGMLEKAAPRAPRFAFLRTPAWDEAPASAQAALEGVVASLGNQADEATLPAPFDEIIDLHTTIMSVENMAYYGGYLETHRELLSDVLAERLEASSATPGHEYVRALNAREEIYDDVAALLRKYDAILCLASPGAAPDTLASTGSAVCNGLWTYLGVPCVSLPRLTVDGMPMGVQLVGRRGEEGKLLRTGRWLDERLQQ